MAIFALLLGAVLLLALNDGPKSDGSEGVVPFIAPGRTLQLGLDRTSRPLGELLEGTGAEEANASFRAYTDRGEVRKVQRGTTIHWEDGRPRLDDGTALIGIASMAGGQAGTLMSVAPTVLTSMNISHSIKEPPLARTSVQRVIVLEVDGLGWDILGKMPGPQREMVSQGNASPALTAFPPRTPTGTAMAITGHDMLHNGILSPQDRELIRPTFLEMGEAAGYSTVWLEGDRSILSSMTELNADMNGDGSSDDEILSALLGHIDNGTDMVLAHFHSVDDEVHDGGTASEGAALAMSRVASSIGVVIERLRGSSTPTLLIIFSDHGLHDVAGGKGEHGSFRHEDMYAMTAFATFGAASEGPEPSLSLMNEGVVVEVLEMDELVSLPFIEGTFEVRSSNGVSTSLFRGISVSDLIDMTIDEDGYTSVTFTAMDGLSMSLPREWVGEGSITMVAYLRDGSQVPEGEGPLRLIVPQELAGEYNGQYCLKGVVSMEVRQ